MSKNDPQYLEHLRHSAAHLLAAAVLELYPKAKRTIGPAIADGFYYDFDFADQKISEEDLAKIEVKMQELVKNWQQFDREEVSKDQALQKVGDNEYKQELINEFAAAGENLSFYKSADFEDLCRGGHVDSPAKELKHFKLLSIAGAYWRGDEKNKMLTRIYGTAFASQAELDEFLKMKEEAKLRDHRKLGKELDLFSFSDLVGSGMPLYSPRGATVRRLLNNYVEELQSSEDYTQVWTPQIAKGELFKRSGHYDKYKADMMRVVSNYSEEEFFLKPMNCPQHTQIYAAKPRSYKDLPLRLTDFAMLYRDERPGELHGLSRVRAFSQDDCHIFCREDQVDAEVDLALQMTKKVMTTLGFKYRYRLSTRDPKTPEKYLGDPATWDKVEAWAVKIMQRNNIEYYDAPGEAAFYAPKMDLMATDTMGREWQLSTVQIDYVQPARFGLEYAAADGTMKTPVMIHRAILGSAERMMMILLEHFAGAFPAWLAPEQVRIIPIGEQNLDYAQKLLSEFKTQGIRATIDANDERMQNKIRQAQAMKVPYMVIVGKKEEEKGVVSLRYRDGEEVRDLPLEKLLTGIADNVKQRKLEVKL